MLLGNMRRGRLTRALARTAAVVVMCTAGGGIAFAKGGTAKPPAPGAVGTGLVPQVPVTGPAAPTVPVPVFTAPFANTSGFDVTGFIQAATANDATCPGLPLAPGSSQRGGSVTVNGLNILVHPMTGDDVADHTANPLWLGEPLPIDGFV